MLSILVGRMPLLLLLLLPLLLLMSHFKSSLPSHQQTQVSADAQMNACVPLCTTETHTI